MDKLNSTFNWLTESAGSLPSTERRQANLLAKILLFLLLFSIIIMFTVLIFNPHQDPQYKQYDMLVGVLVVFFALAYILNRTGYYKIAASLLVAGAAFTPWASLLLDPSILQGDFVPLMYLTFSIFLSSILLPTYFTIALAVLQITGVTLVLLVSSAAAAFNWFSFLTFIFLTSVFSILSNSIIQRNMKHIDEQAHQLTLNEVHLRELSVRDYLTNLFNRRYLEETLEREIQRAARQQNPIGIIMLDVDQFKHINDTQGHATGDTVLRELGKFLAGQVRQSDVACRYGGDEFVLVLPDTTREITKDRAEYLRDEVKNLFIKQENQMPITITISLGVAVFPKDGNTGETILKSADSALLQAKRIGSNRVVAAS